MNLGNIKSYELENILKIGYYLGIDRKHLQPLASRYLNKFDNLPKNQKNQNLKKIALNSIPGINDMDIYSLVDCFSEHSSSGDIGIYLPNSYLYTMNNIKRFKKYLPLFIDNKSCQTCKEKTCICKVDTINFCKNNIEIFNPQPLFCFKYLRVLNLSNNRIKFLNLKDLKELKFLETLNLSCNHISDIEGKLSECKSLKYINLSYNQLTTLKKGVFCGLQNSTILGLKNNQISHIEDGAFTKFFDGIIDLQWNCLDEQEIKKLNNLFKPIRHRLHELRKKYETTSFLLFIIAPMIIAVVIEGKLQLIDRTAPKDKQEQMAQLIVGLPLLFNGSCLTFLPKKAKNLTKLKIKHQSSPKDN